MVVGRDLAPKPPELTTAEWEVASAAAAGKSNAEIAAIRGKSVHTIANQIASALAKLGLTHRRQLGGRLNSPTTDVLDDKCE